MHALWAQAALPVARRLLAPMSDAPAFDGATARRIARAFLPARWYGNRWHYYYSRIKLGSDPLYPGVAAALRGSARPLLDLGCGIGLLAHALRAEGVGVAVSRRGQRRRQDRGRRDARRRARDCATSRSTSSICRAACRRIAAASPSSTCCSTSTTPRSSALLDAAIAMLAPGARLVIRTGIEDGSRRMRLTRAFDRFANVLGWMNAAPRHYPTRGRLARDAATRRAARRRSPRCTATRRSTTG